MSQIPRRTVLVGTATALAVGAQATTSQAQAAAPTRGLSQHKAPTIAPPAVGPIRISDPRSLPHLPKTARLVRWKWARSSGVTIEQAMRTLSPNDILVLPEDERPYMIDSSRGFVRDNRRWNAMTRVHAGLVGLGPGAIVHTSASAFRQGPQTRSNHQSYAVIEANTKNAYFGNFTMYGRDFGGVAYSAINGRGDGTVWERIKFVGAHHGFSKSPPGEAGAINGYRGSNMAVYGVEVDGRDHASGKAVGSSPVMFNRNRNVKIVDLRAHHTKLGMPTLWECFDATIVRLTHTHVALGGSSPGLNLENCKGIFRIYQPHFDLDYLGATGNNGLHLNIGGSRGTSGKVIVEAPTFDAGPAGPKVLAIQHYAAQKNAAVAYTVNIPGATSRRTYRVYN